MTDLHTHILPFLDDGAEDTEEALIMLEMARNSGTKNIVATPHCNMPDFFRNSSEEIRQRFSELKNEAAKQQIDINLFEGMEIFGTEDVAEKLCDGKLFTLNNTKYPLIEFDFYEDPEYIFFVLRKVISKGYVPIVAHPERYECFFENPEMLYSLYKTGSVIQINKGSVLGSFGEKPKIVADILLSHRLAAVATSDAHSSVRRTTVMSEFARYLDENYGDGCSPLLLRENPTRILQNKDIFWEDPLPIHNDKER